MFGKHSVSVNYHMVLNLPEQILNWGQRAKKVTSNSPGLVDFAIGRVIFVLNLPNGQVLFFGHGKIQITEGL